MPSPLSQRPVVSDEERHLIAEMQRIEREFLQAISAISQRYAEIQRMKHPDQRITPKSAILRAVTGL